MTVYIIIINRAIELTNQIVISFILILTSSYKTPVTISYSYWTNLSIGVSFIIPFCRWMTLTPLHSWSHTFTTLDGLIMEYLNMPPRCYVTYVVFVRVILPLALPCWSTAVPGWDALGPISYWMPCCSVSREREQWMCCSVCKSWEREDVKWSRQW